MPFRRIHALPEPVTVTSGEWYPSTSTSVPSVTTTCWMITFAAVIGVPVSSVIGAPSSMRCQLPDPSSHLHVASTEVENDTETSETCLPTVGTCSSNGNSRRGAPSPSVAFADFARSLAVFTKRLCGSYRASSRQNAPPPESSS